MDQQLLAVPANVSLDTASLLHRWPREHPVLVLDSGRLNAGQARWTILAEPESWLADDDDDPLRPLFEAMHAHRTSAEIPAHLPFAGGWIGALSYDLGGRFEPAVRARRAADDRHWPLVQLAWCPAALLLDHLEGCAWLVGTREGVERLVSRLDHPSSSSDASTAAQEAWIGPVHPTTRDEEHRRAIIRALDFIAAGDIFQANITRRWTAPWRGSPRALWRIAREISPAWFSALLELPDGRSMISMSPELFLRVDHRTRAVHTRPIKGTRPASDDPAALLASAKDAAELHMIVDLMRNDLGRVCRFGSVSVMNPRSIETHPTVHHTVADITGTLRPETSLLDLLRATFPPGSVTGAPKIRAMQIIDELEPVRRGGYCGAIGYIDRRGGLALNVAIRTMMIADDRLDYHAGGGVVADSDPDAEVAESHAKAAVFRAVVERVKHVAAAAT